MEAWALPFEQELGKVGALLVCKWRRTICFCEPHLVVKERHRIVPQGRTLTRGPRHIIGFGVPMLRARLEASGCRLVQVSS